MSSSTNAQFDEEDMQIVIEEIAAKDVLLKITALEKELSDKKVEYQQLRNKIKELKDQKMLRHSRNKIVELASNIEAEWIDRQFPWSSTISKILKDTFKFNEFKPKQLAAINATLSKKDVILLMPTGGGKSLTYQLPALVDGNITVVVSPLIALIEDQLVALERFGINGVTIHSNTPKQSTTSIYEDLLNKSPKIRLIFVTPEWVAKSKRFMSILKKCCENKLISRVAIDEVHCCSTWGHDFRPDYEFLGIFRQTLAEVPFIGLTATATTGVLSDVQKMLNMEDAMIITAPFDRPNLHYRVSPKSSVKESAIKYLENLIKEVFADQPGIVYTTTISECINLSNELKTRGLKVAPYHGQLDGEVKTKVHKRWLTGQYQVIIATVAFGMGIDKPDVRFVIHQSLPKSMENLYQEAGRAGRDDKLGHCIVMFSLNDFFKVMGMASSLRDEHKVLSVLEYCLEKQECRRQIIAKHFEETLENLRCNNMCDNCENGILVKQYDVSSAITDVHKIIKFSNENDEKLTLNKLIDAWFQTGPKKNRVKDMAPPKLSRNSAELVMAHMLLTNYIKIDKGYNSYNTICYLKCGPVVLKEGEAVYMPSGKTLSGFPVKPNNRTSDEPTAKRVKRR